MAQEQSVGHESRIRPPYNSEETIKKEMKCKAVGPLKRVPAEGFKGWWTEEKKEPEEKTEPEELAWSNRM